MKSDFDQIFEMELTNKGGRIFRYLLHVDYMGIVEEKLEAKEKKTVSYKPVLHVKDQRTIMNVSRTGITVN